MAVQTITQRVSQGADAVETTPSARAGNIASFAVAISLAAFFLATSLYISSHRLLWFDEVVTVHLARLADWTTLLSALSHGVDSLPPAYYIVVRAFDKLFGDREVAIRLPSTLAMVATLLITFDCARRLTDGLHGLIALAIAAAPLAGEGFEARSYAIYVMFAALALWVWVSVRPGNKWRPVLFGAVLFLGVSFHYYAVLLLVPFALWELSRWKPWQPPSAMLIAGIIGVGLPAVLLSHFILSFSRKFSTGFWSHPSLSELMDIYSRIFVGGSFVLALAIVWIVLVDRKDNVVALLPMQSGEAIGWLFLCVPLVGFVAAELKTNAFAVRYFLGIVPGVAVALSACIGRHFRNAQLVSLGIFLLLATWGVVKQVQIVRHPESVETPGTRDILNLESLLNSDGKRFVLFSDPFQFLEVQYYSQHPDACILLLPSHLGQETSSTHSSPDPYLHQRVELLLSQYYPLQFWQPDQLREHARQTALIKPRPEVLDTMRQAGFDVETRLSKPVEVVYLQ
jgi:uncharacterized membrane protein